MINESHGLALFRSRVRQTLVAAGSFVRPFTDLLSLFRRCPFFLSVSHPLVFVSQVNRLDFNESV